MEDVARAAHCHPSTVSLALRGHARIPAATRERVTAAAARLGYRIHPMISAWVHENNREIGRHAIELLMRLLLSNERGVPAVRQTVLVEPALNLT
jgi:DNA-binding LacI/PurR family transcriptional regulator